MSDITISSARIDRLLAEIERDIQRLQGKREALLELREGSGNGSLSTHTGSDQFRGMRPADAIDALLAMQPGMTQKHVVNHLQGVVASDAKSVRVILNTAIKRRIKLGRIVKRTGGQLYLQDQVPRGEPITSADLSSGRMTRI